MTADSALLAEFIAESREHLGAVEEDFIRLEKLADKPDPETVNRIFRAVHTIKGSSGFFGLTNIGKLSHAMETMLSLMRDGKLAPRPPFTDALLEGVDHLNAMLDDVAASDTHDIAVPVAKINDLLSGSVTADTRKTLDRRVTVEGSGEKFDLSLFELKSLPREMRHYYLLRYDLGALERIEKTTPVQLVKRLLETGMVIDGMLAGVAGDLTAGLPPSPPIYRLLYATVLDKDLIGDAARLGAEDIQDVTAQVRAVSKQPAPAAVPAAKPAPQATAATTTQGTAPASGPSPESTTDTIRIRVDILDRLMMLAGELVLVRNQQLMQVDRSDPRSRTIAQRLDIVTSEMQETIMRTRMQPIGSIFGKFSRIVRDLGNKLGKRIEIEMSGNDVELDKTILEGLTDPLTHIIRNSCDHGIETPEVREAAGKPAAGTIRLRAFHEGGQMNIDISDDGKGIDLEAVKRTALEKGLKSPEEIGRISDKDALALIFLPGFSTADKVSDMSGRGVGMDVVKTGIERLGGTVELNTARGAGTEIFLRLPLTLAIIPSLIVEAGSWRYAIPQINLEELVCLYDDQISRIECAGSREVYRLRGRLLPVVRLSEIFASAAPFTDDLRARATERNREARLRQLDEFQTARKEGRSASLSLTFAVLKVGGRQYGLVIDRVLGTEEIVVKPMHGALKNLSIYAGATVLGDGAVALILDALGIARHSGIDFTSQESEAEERSADAASAARSLLLFRNGPGEVFAIETPRIKRIERIPMQRAEHVANREFVTIDGVSTLIVRLDRCLPVSPCVEREEMFLMLPKQAGTPYGILASELVDIGTFTYTLNTDSFRAAGITGSAIVRDRMTLMVDMDEIARAANPEWYDGSHAAPLATPTASRDRSVSP